MAYVNNYIKLPNQGNINSNLRLLYEMANSCDYADAHGYYTKADIAEIAANALLITTSNKVGADVVGTIRNADIDEGDNSPLQNAKMRMQILRILGLVSADYYSEIYAITEFGELMVSDKITPQQKKDLLRELFLCITSSSESYDFTCSEGFHCFLGLEICYALACLDYRIAVDEMPVITTYDFRDIGDFISKAESFRNADTCFSNEDPHFPRTGKGSPLAQPSNITRTINQILRYCNIIELKPKRIGNKNYYVCTDSGRVYVDNIKKLWNSGAIQFLVPSAFRKSRILSQADYCRRGMDNILIRAKITTAENTGNDDGLYFSPYQVLPETTVLWLSDKEIRPHPECAENKVQAINSSLTLRDLRLKAVYEHNIGNYIAELSKEEVIIRAMSSCGTEDERKVFVKTQMEIHRNDSKYAFYPFVHSLLRIIGLTCVGEVGRFDAFASFRNHVIPVEIKSATEDFSYNQKGVRQAIENKICSYNPLSSDDMEYASIVVGYAHPVNDADIKKLITAAYENLKIKIVAMDLTALLDMCIRVVCDNMQIDLDHLLRGYGIIIE